MMSEEMVWWHFGGGITMTRKIGLLLLCGWCTTACGVADEPLPPQPAQPRVAQPLQPRAPQPVQPPLVQPGQPLQPLQPRLPLVSSRLLQLEEELELLQAQLDIKRAHVKLAEVNAAAKESRFKLLNELQGKAAFSQLDVLDARYAWELAEAELRVCMAEMREIEVKIKYAQRRWEEAKGGRPQPKGEPNARDFSVDEKALAELAERIARLREQIDRNDEAKKKAVIALTDAQEELSRAQALPETNANRANGIKQAETKVQQARSEITRIDKEKDTLLESLKQLQSQFQELKKK
jgi:multidrug resistance efflux pump